MLQTTTPSSIRHSVLPPFGSGTAIVQLQSTNPFLSSTSLQSGAPAERCLLPSSFRLLCNHEAHVLLVHHHALHLPKPQTPTFSCNFPTLGCVCSSGKTRTAKEGQCVCLEFWGWTWTILHDNWTSRASRSRKKVPTSKRSSGQRTALCFVGQHPKFS